MISSSSSSSVIPPSSSSSLARLVVVGTHGGLVGLGGRSACRTPRRRWFGLGAGDSNNISSSNHSGGNDGASTSFLRRFLVGIADGEDVGDGWSAYRDDSGRVYYYYAKTGVTQWDRPGEGKGEKDLLDDGDLNDIIDEDGENDVREDAVVGGRGTTTMAVAGRGGPSSSVVVVGGGGGSSGGGGGGGTTRSRSSFAPWDQMSLVRTRCDRLWR
jgi:hypothetical protein